jgi:hypothetical protein
VYNISRSPFYYLPVSTDFVSSELLVLAPTVLLDSVCFVGKPEKC